MFGDLIPDRAHIDPWIVQVTPSWFDSPESIHGTAHTTRVLIHALEHARESAAPDHLVQPLALAALWHDIGRTNDDVDPMHGIQSARKAQMLGLTAGLSGHITGHVMFAIEHHCLPDDVGMRAARRVPRSHEALEVLRMLKDADALDRVRVGPGDIDCSQLRYEWTLSRIEFAHRLYEAFDVR